jgi:hypothetical protein
MIPQTSVRTLDTPCILAPSDKKKNAKKNHGCMPLHYFFSLFSIIELSFLNRVFLGAALFDVFLGLSSFSLLLLRSSLQRKAAARAAGCLLCDAALYIASVLFLELLRCAAPPPQLLLLQQHAARLPHRCTIKYFVFAWGRVN